MCERRRRSRSRCAGRRGPATDSPSASMARRCSSRPAPGSYVEINAHVEDPATTSRCAAENAAARSAAATIRSEPRVMWGPLVLAGDLGAAPRRGDDGDGDGVRAAAPEPVALVTDRPVGEWLKPVNGKPGVSRRRRSRAPCRPKRRSMSSSHRSSRCIAAPMRPTGMC